MKNIFILFFLFINTESFSQTSFEKGWFLDEDDKRVECYIKNLDWLNNPREFKYKLSQDSEIQITNIENIREFGIYNVSKFIKAEVQIDLSSSNSANVVGNKEPIFQKEVLFLKSIVEGKASLYQYANGNIVRFFYKVNNANIIQLVYIRYLTDKKNVIENTYYKRQLSDSLNCKDLQFERFSELKYYKDDLKNLFIQYNECIYADCVDFEPEIKRNYFRFSLKSGFNYSNFSFRNNKQFSSLIGTDYKPKINFRFGFETEFILPFNNNKWALFVEPTYQYFAAQKEYSANEIQGGVIISKTDYKSIEVPFGGRYYLFLNNGLTSFFNIAYIIDASINSSIVLTRGDGSKLISYKIKSNNNIALGAGFKYKNRFSFETRFNSSRDVMSKFMSWDSDYKTFSFILGYSIF